MDSETAFTSSLPYAIYKQAENETEDWGASSSCLGGQAYEIRISGAPPPMPPLGHHLAPVLLVTLTLLPECPQQLLPLSPAWVSLTPVVCLLKLIPTSRDKDLFPS